MIILISKIGRTLFLIKFLRMFKLAIISTLATSVVNAVDIEADADTMA